MKINTTKQAEAIRPKHIVVGIKYDGERTILTKSEYTGGYYHFLPLDIEFTNGNGYGYNHYENQYSKAEIIAAHKLNGFRCHTFKKMDEALKFLLDHPKK